MHMNEKIADKEREKEFPRGLKSGDVHSASAEGDKTYSSQRALLFKSIASNRLQAECSFYLHKNRS